MLLQSLASISCLLGYSVAVVAAKEKSCTIHDGDNYFDLNRLSASKDYEFETSAGGHKYVLNVCKNVLHRTWNVRVDKPELVGGFIRRDHGDFSLGMFNTTLAVKDGHPLIMMSGGSQCPGSSMTATSAIQFLCDRTVFGAGKPALIAQMPDDENTACNFFFEWRTHHACPAREQHGFFVGTIVFFVTLIPILAMLYLVIVTLYNRYVLKLRGYDQIPTVPHFFIQGYHSLKQRLSSFSSKIHLGGRDSLNSASHHWSATDAGLGGSRHGSGSLEEEEAMLGLHDEDIEARAAEAALEASGGGNPWGAERAPASPGIDSTGVIRL